MDVAKNVIASLGISTRDVGSQRQSTVTDDEIRILGAHGYNFLATQYLHQVLSLGSLGDSVTLARSESQFLGTIVQQAH